MMLRRVAASLILATGAWSSAGLSEASGNPVQVVADPAVLEDFLLTDQEGRPFHFSDLRGHGALVFFGFTHCPGICPTTMFKLRELVQRQEQHHGVVPEVVMISVDGDRDSPAALKSYLVPLSPAFIGLTGNPRDVRGIARNFSAVFFKGLPGDDTGNYQVEHTSQVYLVDENGRLRATFFDASVDDMALAIQAILGKPNRQG